MGRREAKLVFRPSKAVGGVITTRLQADAT